MLNFIMFTFEPTECPEWKTEHCSQALGTARKRIFWLRHSRFHTERNERVARQEEKRTSHKVANSASKYVNRKNVVML